MSYKCLDIYFYPVEGLEKARHILPLLFLPNANGDICFSPTDILTDKYDIFCRALCVPCEFFHDALGVISAQS